MVRVCNPRIGEEGAGRSQGQDHLQLRKEFEASLGYMSPCLSNNNKNSNNCFSQGSSHQIVPMVCVCGCVLCVGVSWLILCHLRGGNLEEKMPPQDGTIESLNLEIGEGESSSLWAVLSLGRGSWVL